MSAADFLVLFLLLQNVLLTEAQHCRKEDEYKLSCSQVGIDELNIQLSVIAKYGLKIIEILDSNIPAITKTLFPINNLEELYVLNISSSNVHAIEEGSLSNFKTLVFLNMSKNNMENVTNLCDNFNYLKILYLDYNNFVKLSPDLFGNCENVNLLSLCYSHVSYIAHETFDTFLELRILLLEGNNLTTFKSNFFLTSGVLTLNINYNNFDTLNLNHIHRLFWSLRNLYASGNKIQEIIPEHHFTLETLYLDNNNLTKLDKNSISRHKHWQKLDIRNNPISYIEEGTFDMSLDELRIGGPMFDVHVLKNGIFKGLRDVKNLDLSNSNIHGIEYNAFSGMFNLMHLNLSNNFITALYNGTFQGLVRLKHLNLSGNKISNFEPGAFDKLTHLEEIFPRTFLSGVTDLFSGQFQQLSNIKNLDLSSLGIQSMSEFTFDGTPSLIYLHLNCNMINRIENYTFYELPNLITLNLTQNPIEYIEVNGFSGLQRVEILYLAQTQIQSLHTDVFSPLISLFYLDVSFGKLYSLETGMHRNLPSLQTLLLNNNMISVLKAYAFWGLNALKILNIEGNSINIVEPAAFLGLEKFSKYKSAVSIPQELLITKINAGTLDGLTYLETLNFSHSRIESINKEAFKFLKNLKDINLEYNNISEISHNSFSLAIVSNCVNLSHNHISVINSSSFIGAQMKCLDLSYNQIRNCGGVAVINFLRELYLSHNKIEFIPKFFFQGLNNLSVLDLRDNLITRISGNGFSSLVNLKTLLFSGNSVKYLEKFSFLNLPNVTSLSFTKLNVTSLEEESFEGLEGILEIKIENSRINVIERRGFNCPKLKILSLLNCSLGQIEDGAFSSLQSLEELYLPSSLTLISHLSPGILEGLERLKYLDLSGSNISALQDKNFATLVNLENLNLQNNKLNIIQSGAFHNLLALKELNLADNHIVNISTLHSVINLRKLYLQNNYIVDFNDGLFRGLHYLKSMNLSGNSLVDIKIEKFFNLKVLTELDMSNNRLYSWSNEALTQMTSLRWIGLRGNNFSCYTLSTILQYFAIRHIKYDYTNEWWSLTNVDGLSCY